METVGNHSNVKYGIFTIIAFSLMIFVLTPNIAYATSFSDTFTTADEYTGSGGTLSGPVVVTVDDEGSTGTVVVTVDAMALTLSTEKITGLYLNVSPESLCTGMSSVGTPDPVAPPTDVNPSPLPIADCSTTVDNYMAAGDGKYDIFSDWPQGAAITPGDISKFTISSTGLLTASSFQALATPMGMNAGPFQVVLRVQGLGTGGQNSGHFSGTFDGSTPPGGGNGIAVGGEFIGIDTTAVLIAGAQSTAAWMIPVILAAAGLGIVIARKF